MLRAGTLWRLGNIEHEPDAPVWVAEVEAILLDGAAATHLREHGSAFLAADDTGQVVGAALHYNHESLTGAQYVAAILLDHRHRGSGLGRELMAAVLKDALTRSGRPHVVWVVHPDNAPMLALSDSVGERLGTDPETGYVQYAHP